MTVERLPAASREVMAQFSVAHDSAYPADEGGEGGDPTLPNGYSERLYNEDLAPLKNQTWPYNIFAFWMSDAHASAATCSRAACSRSG